MMEINEGTSSWSQYLFVSGFPCSSRIRWKRTCNLINAVTLLNKSLIYSLGQLRICCHFTEWSTLKVCLINTMCYAPSSQHIWSSCCHTQFGLLDHDKLVLDTMFFYKVCFLTKSYKRGLFTSLYSNVDCVLAQDIVNTLKVPLSWCKPLMSFDVTHYPHPLHLSD